MTPIRPPVKKKLQLVIRLEEEREPVKFPVNDTITTIGRLKDNDVVIPVNYISAHHAQIQRLHTGEYQLRDLGSQNGTSVNGKKIRKERIDAGDILVLGILGIIVEEADPSMAASTSPTEPVKTVGESTSLRSEYNELLLERERLRKEREELRTSIDRLKEERENPNERQTEPVPKESAAPGPKPTPAPAVPQPLKPPQLQVSPGVNKPAPPSPPAVPNPPAAKPSPPPGPVPIPSPPVPTPGGVKPSVSMPEPPQVSMVHPAPPTSAGAESGPADDTKIEELHDEMASIDSRRIMIHSNVRRLENEIEGGDAGANADSEQHKQEIQGMKSELTEKEEQLESFLSRLNTSQVEPEEFEDTTEEFKEILVDFDQLCSDLENKVQRLEGELKAKNVTTSESGS